MRGVALPIISVAVLVACLNSTAVGQPVGVPGEAQRAFEAGRYALAISILEDAVKAEPDNPLIHYYLGYYMHYLAYDALPLIGYSEDYSDRILDHLRAATSLDPNLGNAYYFIGAEYGARFLNALRIGNVDAMREALLNGRSEGGYANWMLEFCRNTLSSCGTDAILFTGGDLDTDSTLYLQHVEGLRKDVAVIPFPLLDRPWFLLALKRGDETIPASPKFPWSEEQIMSMRPYKWKENAISIPLSSSVRIAFELPDDQREISWRVSPDIDIHGQTYLSAGRAAFVEILRSNAWTRPVHFSLGSHLGTLEGLPGALELKGFSLQLSPRKSDSQSLLVDVNATEVFLRNANHFRFISEAASKDYSRVAGILNNYVVVFYQVLKHLAEEGQQERFAAVLSAMEEALPEDVIPIDTQLKDMLDQMMRQVGIPPGGDDAVSRR